MSYSSVLEYVAQRPVMSTASTAVRKCARLNAEPDRGHVPLEHHFINGGKSRISPLMGTGT